MPLGLRPLAGDSVPVDMVREWSRPRRVSRPLDTKDSARRLATMPSGVEAPDDASGGGDPRLASTAFRDQAIGKETRDAEPLCDGVGGIDRDSDKPMPAYERTTWESQSAGLVAHLPLDEIGVLPPEKEVPLSHSLAPTLRGEHASDGRLNLRFGDVDAGDMGREGTVEPLLRLMDGCGATSRISGEDTGVATVVAAVEDAAEKSCGGGVAAAVAGLEE